MFLCVETSCGVCARNGNDPGLSALLYDASRPLMMEEGPLTRSEGGDVRRQGKRVLGFVLAVLLLPLSGTGLAYDLPAVNLGFTSFLDGGPPAGPGFYFSQYLQSYASDSFRNDKGEALFPDGVEEDLNLWVSMTQFIYQSDQELLLGGKWGVNLMIPVVGLDMDYGMPVPFPEDNGTGVGDILIGPYLQWDPVMGANGPKFMHRVELQVTFPTGKYDSDKELNPGSNTFTFNPYWAFTGFITPQFTVSGRLHYLHNFENDDPNRLFQGADDTRAGDAFHGNFAAAYEVLPKQLRLGVNGYYLNQFENSEVDGKSRANSAEKVTAIGPGGVYHFGPDDHLFFNLYFETEAENRPEGTRFNMRYVHHF